MKRINILLVIIIAALFVACSQSFEDKAKSHLREMAEIEANDPNSLIIQDEKVIFSNDSVCFISYVVKDKNIYGNYTKSEYEYYYINTNHGDRSKPKSDYYGTTLMNGKNKSVTLSVDKIMETTLKHVPELEVNEKEMKRARDNAYFLVANMLSALDDRKVPK